MAGAGSATPQMEQKGLPAAMAAPHFGQYIDRLLVEKSLYLIT
jgi:hypothetical protein